MGDAGAARAFRGDVQGLRAIAVGAVVLYHAGVPFLSGGYIGVDVFFVISGFLITSHLLSGLEREGRVSFAAFYARRARRILPASFAVLILSVAAAAVWFPPLLMHEVWRGAVATALYVPNVLFAWNGTNYLAESTPSLFQHYWSLGVEEQFYLVWPVVLAASWYLTKSRRALVVVVLVLVAVSLAACVWLTFRQQPWAFFSLPTRAWELGAGALVALVLGRSGRLLQPLVAALFGWAGLTMIIVSAVFFNDKTAFPGWWALVPVVGTVLLIASGSTPSPFGPTAALSLPPMQFVGAISYSLYLVHWPALVIPQAAVGYGNPLPLWVSLVIAALCVPVAWAIFKFVEAPGQAAGWLVGARPRRTLFAVPLASALAVLIASGAIAYVGSKPLSSSEMATATVISDPPAATSFVPENLRPSLSEAASDQPVMYADGCHQSFTGVDIEGCVYGDPQAQRIVLFGDSHAAQWFPAVFGFAERHGYAVETHTKSSCPSVSADVMRGGVPYTRCTQWRSGVIDLLNAERPALVILANFGNANLGGNGFDQAAAWEVALGETLDALTVPTAVITDTPNMQETPSVCLSAHLLDTSACARPAAAALGAPARQAEARATAERGVPLIDLTRYICDAEYCAPIIGDTLVYRDAHHLTATFSAKLSPVLGRALLGQLASRSERASSRHE